MEIKAEKQGAEAVGVSTNGHVDLFDPFELKRPGREVHHKSFIDPAHPSQVVKLSLRKSDTIDKGRAVSEMQRMISLYVTGSDEMPPGPFPLIGGEQIQITAELLAEPCGVWAMQVGPPEGRQPRLWAPEHFVAMSIAMPDAWAAIIRFANELRSQGTRAEGNSPAPPTE